MATKARAIVRWIAVAAGLALVAVVGPPAIFLLSVWWRDPAEPLPPPLPGRNDVSLFSNAFYRAYGSPDNVGLEGRR